MQQREPVYWLIKNISYQDTVKLSANNLVESFQRDSKANESRFWPGSKGVFKHLHDNLPEGAAIFDDSNTNSAKKVRAVPAVIHKSVGLDIADD